MDEIRRTPWVFSEPLLRRYLLGQSYPFQAEFIERNAFSDEELSHTLAILEDELIEDYVTDSLDEVDTAAFELLFLTSPERREKIRVSARLLNRPEILDRVPKPLISIHQAQLKIAVQSAIEYGANRNADLGPFEVTEHMLLAEPKSSGERKFDFGKTSNEMKDVFFGRATASTQPSAGKTEWHGLRYVRRGKPTELGELPSDPPKISAPPPSGARFSRFWKVTAPWLILGTTNVLLIVLLVVQADRFRRPAITKIDPPRLGVHFWNPNVDYFSAPFEEPLVVKISGKGFKAGAIVQLNGENLNTTFLDENNLSAKVVRVRDLRPFLIIVVNPSGMHSEPAYIEIFERPTPCTRPVD